MIRRFEPFISPRYRNPDQKEPFRDPLPRLNRSSSYPSYPTKSIVCPHTSLLQYFNPPNSYFLYYKHSTGHCVRYITCSLYIPLPLLVPSPFPRTSIQLNPTPSLITITITSSRNPSITPYFTDISRYRRRDGKSLFFSVPRRAKSLGWV